MTLKAFTVSLLTIWLLSSGISAQDLQFYREKILFCLDGKKVRVDASYHFCNVGPDDLRARLFYPFPEGDLELVDSLIVEEIGSETAISFLRSGSGIFFEISVPRYGQAGYRVFFSQLARNNHFRYILTTTSAWGKPFESAIYQLQTTGGIEPDSLSIEPDSTFIRDGVLNYLWKRSDFMPDRDFEVFYH